MNNLPFKDKHGVQVKPGDKIRILKNYSWDYLNGQEGIASWDEKHGMFTYQIPSFLAGESSFASISEFEIINDK